MGIEQRYAHMRNAVSLPSTLYAEYIHRTTPTSHHLSHIVAISSTSIYRARARTNPPSTAIPALARFATAALEILVDAEDVDDAPDEVFVAEPVDFAAVKVDDKVILELAEAAVVAEVDAVDVTFAVVLVTTPTTPEEDTEDITDDVTEDVYEGPVESCCVVVDPPVADALEPPEIWNGAEYSDWEEPSRVINIPYVAKVPTSVGTFQVYFPNVLSTPDLIIGPALRVTLVEPSMSWIVMVPVTPSGAQTMSKGWPAGIV